MDEKLWRGDSGGEGENKGRDGGNGGHEAVGEGVGQRAQAQHDEEGEAVGFQDERESREACVVREKAVREGGEQGTGRQEGAERAKDVGGGGNEPTASVLGGSRNCVKGDIPFREAIHEAGECDAGRVAYHRRKSGNECQGPEDEPAAVQALPFLCNWL